MNKNYKPINSTFREHFKIHGYLSLEMIEELLDKVDDLEREIQRCYEMQPSWQRQYAR